MWTAAARRRSPHELCRQRRRGRRECFWNAQLKFHRDFKFVGDRDSVARKRENRFAESWSSFALEPRRRAPRIVRRARHQTVAHSVFVNVAQTGQIRTLIGYPRVPILKPDSTTGFPIEFVHCASRERMQASNHTRQRLGRRGIGNEMVVIRKYGPSLEIPPVVRAEAQQRFT